MMRIKTPAILILLLCLAMTASVSARSWNVIAIDKVEGVNLGEEVNLKVDLNRGDFQFGRFALSMYYDPNALTLTDAGLGDLLTACDWEYFSYSDRPCDGCPYNIIDIEAIAEYYDNGQTASCLEGPGKIATLVFTATADSSYVCTSTPVGFYWEKCFDNLFVNTREDTLWFSDYVLDFDGNDITGTPNFGGAPKDCLVGYEEVPFRFLDFVTGGVIFKCAPSYLCGDINGDDKINLLDPVFLTSYLFKSGEAPDPVERGDVDCSDTVPDIADLVYIINYIFYLGDDPCCLF
ncbi:MAG: hypothetical protein GWN00_14535 [Aliifodinibius sp.]|nr:hypothetical protein [candidate division Zixibacteria bacterium]NIT57394.1 hypothetical protein [Fodinibius sp.]NIV12315.1 hypothetical protein [Fodinibius sp.]NIY25976.1 hypothetical protein [Fodinibius sp.]